MTIHVLPEEVANKIAAGEVVERPASVVKELVENAIDAGSTEIRVELIEGGKRLVRVQDNGTGMTRADAELSLRRHATSKLTSADDLETVGTLGFRGEALPSIASVSRFELVTRTTDEVEGTRVVVEGGRSRNVSSIGCPVGTQVRVSDLFYNLPARRKFLKTETTELNKAVNHVQSAALAHPDVRLTLLHGNRSLIDVPICGSRRERLRLLYGREFADHLLDFTKTFERFEIECFIGDANLTKSNRAYQLFFLNGRPIRDSAVSAALAKAAGEVIPHGRFAVAFLFLRMPPEDVDVNVHPAKAEVRFKYEGAIFRNVVQALSQGIAESTFIPDVDTSGADDAANEERSTPETRAYPVPEHRKIIPPSRTRYGSERAPASRTDTTLRWNEKVIRPTPVGLGWAEPLDRSDQDSEASAGSAGSRMHPDAVEVELLDFDALELVGGLFATYIVVADLENAYLIDQHVASERVHYERILTQVASQKVESQGLLTPRTVELTATQMVRVEAHAGWMERFGIHAEALGGQTVHLNVIPAILGVEQAERMFTDLLDGLESDWQPDRSWQLIQERAAATLACHAAVRAGDRLTAESQQALLRDLSAARLPFNCPHGRPIIIRMRRAEIESRFHRR